MVLGPTELGSLMDQRYKSRLGSVDPAQDAPLQVSPYPQIPLALPSMGGYGLSPIPLAPPPQAPAPLPQSPVSALAAQPYQFQPFQPASPTGPVPDIRQYIPEPSTQQVPLVGGGGYQQGLTPMQAMGGVGGILGAVGSYLSDDPQLSALGNQISGAYQDSARSQVNAANANARIAAERSQAQQQALADQQRAHQLYQMELYKNDLERYKLGQTAFTEDRNYNLNAQEFNAGQEDKQYNRNKDIVEFGFKAKTNQREDALANSTIGRNEVLNQGDLEKNKGSLSGLTPENRLSAVRFAEDTAMRKAALANGDQIIQDANGNIQSILFQNREKTLADAAQIKNEILVGFGDPYVNLLPSQSVGPLLAPTPSPTPSELKTLEGEGSVGAAIGAGTGDNPPQTSGWLDSTYGAVSGAINQAQSNPNALGPGTIAGAKQMTDTLSQQAAPYIFGGAPTFSQVTSGIANAARSAYDATYSAAKALGDNFTVPYAQQYFQGPVAGQQPAQPYVSNQVWAPAVAPSPSPTPAPTQWQVPAPQPTPPPTQQFVPPTATAQPSPSPSPTQTVVPPIATPSPSPSPSQATTGGLPGAVIDGLRSQGYDDTQIQFLIDNYVMGPDGDLLPKEGLK